MSDYLLTFRGYVDENKRPDDFPCIIEDLVFIHANTQDEVAKSVNVYSLYYVKLQGMPMCKNPHSMEDFSALDSGRMWVPMHMLTHFDVEVRQITGKMPIFDKEGRIELDGDEKLVQN